MRTITTPEVTDAVFLINKAKELKTAHSLSIIALEQHQRVASVLYAKLLNEVDYEPHSNIINPLEKACDIFDELVEEYRHNEYINDITTHWLNGEYVALPDTIKRTK